MEVFVYDRDGKFVGTEGLRMLDRGPPNYLVGANVASRPRRGSMIEIKRLRLVSAHSRAAQLCP
jgi:hypothetical protein